MLKEAIEKTTVAKPLATISRKRGALQLHNLFIADFMRLILGYTIILTSIAILLLYQQIFGKYD